MGCCKYSSEFVSNNKTSIENVFISDFMINSPGSCVKVYLYGLYKCNNPDSIDNELKAIASALNYSEEDVMSAFMYWEDLNLVKIVTKSPFEVRYLPIKNASMQLIKFNADKYQGFNIKAQEIIANRMINPNEYQEYYYLIEKKGIEADALLMIIEYCVKIKGANIAGNYILTVAKNWIFDGIKTCDDVQERILELDRNSSDVQLVLKALGLRRKASEEEYRLYLNWKNELGVEHENIMHLARKVKVKGAGFSKLDSYVSKCYALKLESKKEIDDYFNNLDGMFELAKSTCRAMGLRYDNLETVVDNYIAPWVSLGFEPEAIIKIANFCFRYSVRTLEGLHGKINQMYRQGLLTSESIDEYIQDLAKNDDNIINILQKLGIDRNVSSSDRSMYNIWISTWQISDELLEFAIEKSMGMNMPMQYLNKLLSSFYAKKITTVEDAEKLMSERKTQTFEKNEKMKGPEKAKGKEYSKDELNSLINNLFEVEI